MKQVYIISTSRTNILQLISVFGGKGVEVHSNDQMRSLISLSKHGKKVDLFVIDDAYGEPQRLIEEVEIVRGLWSRARILVFPMPTILGPYLALLRSRADVVIPKRANLDPQDIMDQAELEVLVDELHGK